MTGKSRGQVSAGVFQPLSDDIEEGPDFLYLPERQASVSASFFFMSVM